MVLDFSHINAIVAVLVMILNQFIVIMLVEMINPQWLTQQSNLWIAIAYLLTIIYFLTKSMLSGQKVESCILLKWGWFKDLWKCFLTQLLISMGAYQLLLGIIYWINSSWATTLSQSNSLAYANQLDLIIGIFCVSFLVPIGEELLFRGIIFTRLLKRFPVERALSMMALLFGILHGLDLVGATIFGYLCGLLYLKYKTLWAPILLHMLNNGMTCLIQLYDLKFGIVMEALTPSLVYDQVLIGIVYLTGGLAFLKWIHKGLKSG